MITNQFMIGNDWFISDWCMISNLQKGNSINSKKISLSIYISPQLVYELSSRLNHFFYLQGGAPSR